MEDDPDAWLAQAKCKGLPVDWFVSSTPGGTNEKALGVCHGYEFKGGGDGRPPCPVRDECHQAGEQYEEVGVWGGNVRHQRGVRIIEPVRRVQDARPKKVS